MVSPTPSFQDRMTRAGLQAESIGPLRDRQRPSRSPGVRSTLIEARFDPLLPFDAWREYGAKIASYSSGTSWWLGDWLVFGRTKYGRRYKDAIAATGLDYQTLRNYAVVARRFEVSRRRYNLTFQHHAEVCSLCDDEQNLWLDRAADQGWSKAELRRRRRQVLAASHGSEQAHLVKFAFASVRADRWRLAAAQDGVDLGAWISDTLDRAADDRLERYGARQHTTQDGAVAGGRRCRRAGPRASAAPRR